jgi:hypothetical protein
LKQSSAVHIQALVSADGILPGFCWLTSAFSYKFSFSSGRTEYYFPYCSQALHVSGYFIGALISKNVVLLFINLTVMSKEEIKYEISKVLDHFSDKALSELLAFLKELDSKHETKSITSSLNTILSEDSELLAKLAQ